MKAHLSRNQRLHLYLCTLTLLTSTVSLICFIAVTSLFASKIYLYPGSGIDSPQFTDVWPMIPLFWSVFFCSIVVRHDTSTVKQQRQRNECPLPTTGANEDNIQLQSACRPTPSLSLFKTAHIPADVLALSLLIPLGVIALLNSNAFAHYHSVREATSHCPTYLSSDSGTLEYYCTQAYRDFVRLEIAAMVFMALSAFGHAVGLAGGVGAWVGRRTTERERRSGNPREREESRDEIAGPDQELAKRLWYQIILLLCRST